MRGRVWVPRFNLTGNVYFCVDTGTGYTTLMARDVSAIGIDETQLDDELGLVTVGGEAPVFLEPAFVQFTDAGASRVYAYRIVIAIATSASTMHIPSLLGRDVINRWRIDYHPTAGALTGEVISADEVVDLGAG